MKNKTLALLAFLALISFSFCTSSKKSTTAMSTTATATFAYANDIAPIMEASCAPCHFPESGKKKQLDTYEAVAKNFEDILERVQLPVNHENYMPFKSKTPAFTEAQIQMLKTWKAENMPK